MKGVLDLSVAHAVGAFAAVRTIFPVVFTLTLFLRSVT